MHIQSSSVHCTSCWILNLCWLIVWMMTLMLTLMFFSSSYLRFTCRYMSLTIQIWVNRSTVMCVMLAALIWTWWYDTEPYILTRNHSSVSTVIIKRAGKKISKRTSSFTLVSMYTVEFAGEQPKTVLLNFNWYLITGVLATWRQLLLFLVALIQEIFHLFETKLNAWFISQSVWATYLTTWLTHCHLLF